MNYTLVSISLISRLDPLIAMINIILLMYEIIAGIYVCYLVFMVSSAVIQELWYSDELPDIDKDRTDYPLVTIVIPTCDSRLDNIELSIDYLIKNPYPRKEIIIADNSNDETFLQQLELLVTKKKVEFYHKKDQKGFKAGILNYILPHVSGEYLIIIDSDQILKQEAIYKLVQMIETDDQIAYVQGKFEIYNADTLIRKSNSILYAWYYELLSRAKDLRKSVLFNGTSAIFRKTVLEDIGGFSEETLTEDIDTSFIILSRGYKSRLLDSMVTTALVSWRSKDLINQFWRWTNGATAVAKKRTISVIKSRKIGIIDKIDLILNGFAFFGQTGVVLTSFLICLMSVLGISVIDTRPDLFGIPGIILIPGGLIAVLVLCITLSIFWIWKPEQGKAELFKNSIFMIPFYILSISLQFFIITALIDGVIKDIPSKWNREVVNKKSTAALLLLGCLYVITAWISLMNADVLVVYMIFLLICVIFPFYFFWKDTKMDVNDLEKKYVDKMRALLEQQPD